MKTKWLPIFFMIVACSGGGTKEETTTENEYQTVETALTEEELEELEVVERGYVINPNGAIIYADKALRDPIDTLENGILALVTADQGETKEIKERFYSDNGWYWMRAYMNTTDLGSIKEVKIAANELLPTNSKARDHITIEKINQATFEAVPGYKSDAKFVIDDTVSVIGDTLRIPLKNGEVLDLMSRPEEEEEYVVYEYVGHNDSMNTFLIEATYYEWQEEVLMNAFDGEVQTEIGMTSSFYSPDNSWLIALASYEYTNGTDLSLYHFFEGQPELLLDAVEFDNWITDQRVDAVRWETENTVVARVMHSAVYYEVYGCDDCWEYIRITILSE